MSCLAISCARAMAERIVKVRPDLCSRVVVRPHPISVALIPRRARWPRHSVPGAVRLLRTDAATQRVITLTAGTDPGGSPPGSPPRTAVTTHTHRSVDCAERTRNLDIWRPPSGVPLVALRRYPVLHGSAWPKSGFTYIPAST